MKELQKPLIHGVPPESNVLLADRRGQMGFL
jgi:hypothetical protein